MQRVWPAIYSLVLSHTIYLNRTPTQVRPGSYNDSSQQVSTLVAQPIVTPGWDTDDDTWQQTVACVERTWSKFDMTVVTTPPTNGHYIEALIGGSPGAIGADVHFSGESPLMPDCSIIEDSVVFVFPDKVNGNATQTCAIISQEVAHSFGLDHEMLASDPMTYLPYDSERSFQDQLVSCGEFQARSCGPDPANPCSEKQNSAQMLAQRVGFADGVILGTTTITSPRDMTTQPSSFTVEAIANTSFGAVSGAALVVDGQRVDYITGPGPYAFSTPNLSGGNHEIEVVADQDPHQISAMVDVVVDDEAHDAEALGCSAGGGGTGVGGFFAFAFVVFRAGANRAKRCERSV